MKVRQRIGIIMYFRCNAFCIKEMSRKCKIFVKYILPHFHKCKIFVNSILLIVFEKTPIFALENNNPSIQLHYEEDYNPYSHAFVCPEHLCC